MNNGRKQYVSEAIDFVVASSIVDRHCFDADPDLDSTPCYTHV